MRTVLTFTERCFNFIFYFHAMQSYFFLKTPTLIPLTRMIYEAYRVGDNYDGEGPQNILILKYIYLLL